MIRIVKGIDVRCAHFPQGCDCRPACRGEGREGGREGGEGGEGGPALTFECMSVE